MGLEGKTPAEDAGLDVKGWKKLLETAVKRVEKLTDKQ